MVLINPCGQSGRCCNYSRLHQQATKRAEPSRRGGRSVSHSSCAAVCHSISIRVAASAAALDGRGDRFDLIPCSIPIHPFRATGPPRRLRLLDPRARGGRSIIARSPDHAHNADTDRRPRARGLGKKRCRPAATAARSSRRRRLIPCTSRRRRRTLGWTRRSRRPRVLRWRRAAVAAAAAGRRGSPIVSAVCACVIRSAFFYGVDATLIHPIKAPPTTDSSAHSPQRTHTHTQPHHHRRYCAGRPPSCCAWSARIRAPR